MLFAFIDNFQKLIVRIIRFFFIQLLERICCKPVAEDDLLEFWKSNAFGRPKVVFEKAEFIRKMINHDHVAIQFINHVGDLVLPLHDLDVFEESYYVVRHITKQAITDVLARHGTSASNEVLNSSNSSARFEISEVVCLPSGYVFSILLPSTINEASGSQQIIDRLFSCP